MPGHYERRKLAEQNPDGSSMRLKIKGVEVALGPSLSPESCRKVSTKLSKSPCKPWVNDRCSVSHPSPNLAFNGLSASPVMRTRGCWLVDIVRHAVQQPSALRTPTRPVERDNIADSELRRTTKQQSGCGKVGKRSRNCSPEQASLCSAAVATLGQKASGAEPPGQLCESRLAAPHAASAFKSSKSRWWVAKLLKLVKVAWDSGGQCEGVSTRPSHWVSVAADRITRYFSLELPKIPIIPFLPRLFQNSFFASKSWSIERILAKTWSSLAKILALRILLSWGNQLPRFQSKHKTLQKKKKKKNLWSQLQRFNGLSQLNLCWVVFLFFFIIFFLFGKPQQVGCHT